MQFLSLPQKRVAQVVGVTARTVQNWTDAGCPRNPDGTYSAPAVVQWLLQKETGGDFDDQRQRLAAAQAEKVESENAVRRGELADMRLMIRVWQDHIGAARAKLLGMAPKLSGQLVDIHDASIIAAAIRAEVSAALTELSNYEPATGKESDSDPEAEAPRPTPKRKPK